MSRSRTIDWRFFLALALALMVAYLCAVGWNGIAESKAKSDRIDALVGALDERDDTIAERDAMLDAERRSSVLERRRLLLNQRLLVEYTSDLADRQSALLSYLQRHGIDIPPRFITEVPPPVLRNPDRNRGSGGGPPNDDSGSTSSSNGGRHHSGTPDGPGNSENAPGHNKPKKPKKSKRGKG